ncbi:hypothetical protein LCGC14_2204790 [marine sediment metagenome]|uniref:Radical SAM core domain-containing protein n=1 Tax=marine sediment metagenome TaxID=412755 RepID=A0A0F9DFV4_9ZZZZ
MANMTKNIKEWSNQYNPFNSMKILFWSKHMEAFAKEEYPPPPSVDVDPSNMCNFKCMWCNAYDIICKKSNNLPTKHLIKISDMCADWGVKSMCVAGGGEPMMNVGFLLLLQRNHKNDIETGVITNGSLIKDKHIDTMVDTCRWVGISVDSGTKETFEKIKKVRKDMFDVVINNINKLTNKIKQVNSKCDVAYKYLLHPLNASEIYEAAKLAKSLGVNDFHMRPVGWDNITITKKSNSLLFTPDIFKTTNEQIKMAMELEDDAFHFYGVRHKFDQNFKRKVNFSRCWAIPLIPTFGADGNVHTCFDMRGREDLIMCSHYPDPEEIRRMWNTEKHKELIRTIDISKCPRCTFGIYNEMVEKVFIKDMMCRNFP